MPEPYDSKRYFVAPLDHEPYFHDFKRGTFAGNMIQAWRYLAELQSKYFLIIDMQDCTYVHYRVRPECTLCDSEDEHDISEVLERIPIADIKAALWGK